LLHTYSPRIVGEDRNDAYTRFQSIDMIAPYRRRRQKPKTQDGRKLRRYKRRWKVERLFAWLGNFRRLVVRYENKVNNFLGFVHLGCIVILLGRFASLV
jgi:transposase